MVGKLIIIVSFHKDNTDVSSLPRNNVSLNNKLTERKVYKERERGRKSISNQPNSEMNQILVFLLVVVASSTLVVS
jgi:hypothetical protein